MLTAMIATKQIALQHTPAALAAVAVAQTLRAHGHSAYLVGGCVRDLLLGLVPKDYDIATSAHPDQVRRLFAHVVEVGVAFGVLRVRQPSSAGVVEIEVATFRAEAAYSDGRRPDSVHFTDAKQDVLRRDFTINGLLLDPLDESGQLLDRCPVVDWVGGLADLAAAVLRAIGDPAARFGEDALRLLRAPRFAARFDLQIDSATRAAIQALAPTLSRVSAERISAEVLAMLQAPSAPKALQWLADLGLAQQLWPQLVAVDASLAQTQTRFIALQSAISLPVARQADAFAPCGDIDAALAIATLFWPAQQHVGSLPEDWRLSRDTAVRLRETWLLAGQLLTIASEPMRPRLIRTLRSPQADAALLLLLALSNDKKWQELRQLRASTPKAQWWPTLWVTGETLLAWGHAQGPLFRAALLAAEDAQLAGESLADVEAAARRALPMAN